MNTRIASAVRRLGLLTGAVAFSCTPAPSPAPMPPDASDAAPPPVLDGGYLHSYRCPVGDGGASWSCQDGLTTAVGTCAGYGCVPAAP